MTEERYSMSRKTRTTVRTTGMALGMSVLLTLAAGSTWAQGLEGVDVILAKDEVSKTLSLSRGSTLYVGPNTRIRGEDGSLISFAQLPAAIKVEHGYQTVGGETVEYRAQEVRGKLLALELKVLPATIR